MRLTFFFLLLIRFSYADAQSIQVFQQAQLLDVHQLGVTSPMDVWVENGVITGVYPTGKKIIPQTAAVTNCSGKYLAPVMGDAHVHFFQTGSLYTRPDAIDLRKKKPYKDEIDLAHRLYSTFRKRYQSAGIGHVIDVGATYGFLDQRKSDSANRKSGATVSMTGPLLTTYLPAPFKDLGKDAPFVEMKSPEQAVQLVQEQVKQGADFIKIWYIVLSNDKESGARQHLPLIKAVIDEAHRLKKRVAVHATERITAELAVQAGADFLVHNIDDEVITQDFAFLLAKQKVVVSPTLIVGGNYGKVLGKNYHPLPEDFTWADPFTLGTILDYPWPDTTLARSIRKYITTPAVQREQAHTDSVSIANLKILLDAGVRIAVGTDAGNTGTQHVSSYFTELAAMRAVGFTPAQLWQSATIQVARAIGEETNWGSIEVGKDAEFLLLNESPLVKGPGEQESVWVYQHGSFTQPQLSWTPAELAQKQLNAYNAHDLEAFLAPYAEDVEAYEGSKLLFKGKELMRKEYQFLKHTPGLYCRLLNRIVQGNTVIDHEEIWLGESAKNLQYGIAIYTIEKGKIQKVQFIQ